MRKRKEEMGKWIANMPKFEGPGSALLSPPLPRPPLETSSVLGRVWSKQARINNNGDDSRTPRPSKCQATGWWTMEQHDLRSRSELWQTAWAGRARS